MRTIIAWALAASATLVCATLPARAADKPPASSGIVINLEPPRYWETDAPFIDEFKRAGGWITEFSQQKPECS